MIIDGLHRTTRVVKDGLIRIILHIGDGRHSSTHPTGVLFSGSKMLSTGGVTTDEAKMSPWGA